MRPDGRSVRSVSGWPGGCGMSMVPLLTYQKAVVLSPARLLWVNWSRQVGKSFAFSLRRVLRGLSRRRTQLLLSGSERQSRELMEKVRQHCEVLRLAGISTEGSWVNRASSQMEMVLPSGARIIGLPANPRTVRGFTGDVFLDEFAMHMDDRAIWAALLPSILRGGGELDVASTPKGMKSLFYELKANDRFRRFTVTIHEAAAQGLPVDVAGLEGAMGDDQLFRQEFCCEFLDETTAFLTYEQIARCEDADLTRDIQTERLRDRAARLAVGVDVGRRRDLTVIWLLEEVGPLLVTRGVVELAETPFRQQASALREILKMPAARRCCIDATGLGMSLAETLLTEFGGHRVEAVTFTPLVKNELAHRLRFCVEEARIRIPACREIRDDWHAMRRLIGSGGVVRFEADRGVMGHSDRFWAAGLAVRAAGTMSGQIEGVTEGRLVFSRSGAW